MSISWETASKCMAKASSFDDSNLELNKKLYIAQMYFMGINNGSRRIDADFEAWDLGPVLPGLYHRAKIFGSAPVTDVFFDPRSDGTQEDNRFIRHMAE